jgi:uncharacterized protein (TIGR02996 family)
MSSTIADIVRIRSNLLADILANPKDDEVRLVFADHEEEYGNTEWASLIRVGVEKNILLENIANIGECHCNEINPTRCSRCRQVKKKGYWDLRVNLRDEEHTLVKKVAPRLLPEGAKKIVVETNGVWFEFRTNRRKVVRNSREAGWAITSKEVERVIAQFDRGFIHRLTLKHDSWMSRGPDLIDMYPLERVMLCDRVGRIFDDGRHLWVKEGEDDQFRKREDIPHYCIAKELYDLLPDTSKDRVDYIDVSGWGGEAKEYPRGVSCDDQISDVCLRWARKESIRRRTPSIGSCSIQIKEISG